MDSDPGTNGGAGGAAAAGAGIAPGVGDASGAGVGATGGADTGQPSIQDFKSMLPEDLRDSPTLADIKDINGLARSYVEAQKLIGANRTVIPKDDAPPEVMDKFYKAIGRPETPDDYKFQVPEVDGYDFSKTVEWAKPIFHKAGLTAKQGNEILSALADSIKENLATQQQNAAQTQAMLEAEFGDKLAFTLDGAKRAMIEFGGEDFYETLVQAGLDKDLEFVKTFAKIHEAVSEDRAVDGSQNPGFVPGPAQAAMEIEALKADQNFMNVYQDHNHPGHKGAVAKMQRLFELAYPAAKK